MDFPLELRPNPKEDMTPPVVVAGAGSDLEFVYGSTELRNDLYLLLKTTVGVSCRISPSGLPQYLTLRKTLI